MSAHRSGRQIGPLGTLARTVGGLVAISLPIALHGLSVTEALVAFLGLPLAAILATPLVELGTRRFALRAPVSCHATCFGPACVLIIVLVAANDAMVAPSTANGNVTLAVWLGASMLLAAARGYGGCEVLAIPNLLSGRRDQIGCLLFTPIDRADARRDQPTGAGARS
jgi:hypothetical protein